MSELVCSISRKRQTALQRADDLPPSVRSCVHEFGLPIVEVLLKFGITDPRHIREVVKEIWAGPRQLGQRSNTMDAVDYMLSRGPVSSAALRRMLAENNMIITTVEPTRRMINASLEEVSGFNCRVTKEEKHRRRLRAALRAVLNENGSEA